MRPLVLFVLLVFATPTAMAVEAISGTVHFDAAPRVDGDALLVAATGLLDLSPDAQVDRAPSVRFEAMAGRHVVHWTEEYFVGLQRGGTATTPLSSAGGSLVVSACGSSCRMLLIATDGHILLKGTAAGSVAWTTESTTVSVGAHGPGAFQAGTPLKDVFHATLDEDWIRAGGDAKAGEWIWSNAVPEAAGRATLFLWDVTVEIAEDEGRVRTHFTGAREAPVTGPAGVQIGTNRTLEFLVLDLEDIRLEASAGSEAQLFAPAATLDLSGVLESQRTSGALTVGAQRTTWDDQSLRIEGVVSYLLAREGPSSPAILDAGASEALARVDGHATFVAIGERAIVERTSVHGIVLGAALLTVIGAWLASGKAGVIASLYSRVERSHLLDNPNRRAIHAGILQRPGANVQDLIDATGLAQVVVRHHLRILEWHGLIAVRRDGRSRCHFIAGAVPSQTRFEVDRALRGPTRRQVARLLATAEGGLTQREVVEATGMTQRLAAYHLARLCDRGLVDGDDDRPRHYRAMAALREGLRASAKK